MRIVVINSEIQYIEGQAYLFFETRKRSGIYQNRLGHVVNEMRM